MSRHLGVYGSLTGLAALLTACGLFAASVPGVSAVSPANGATGVALDTAVVASLNLPDGPLNPSTLSDASVSLSEAGGAAVTGTRSLSEDGKTLSLAPTSALEPGTTYTFSVTPDVLTSAGTPFRAWQSTFTTGSALAGKPSDSDLVPSRSPLGFTAGGETQSDTRTLTLTNSSSKTISVSSLTLSGDAAAQFSLADSSAFALAPGQAKPLELTFTPGGTGPQRATLNIQSNASQAPTLAVPLSGLGVVGQGGDNEPSLQWILDAYGLPVATGDSDPATTAITTDADSVNNLLGDEVSAQRFQKAAGAAQVSLEVLAVFGVDNSPVLEFGTYRAGNPDARTQRFEVMGEPELNEQRLGPDIVGGTGGYLSFNPGDAPFGFYSFWPGNAFFQERLVYSEDRLNTFPNALPHHVRTYELKNPDGSVEANAYILATEEFTQGFDYNDVVVIVRNVTPLASTENLQVSNALGLPSGNRMILHRIASTAGNFCPGDPDPALPPCDPNVQRWAEIFVRDTGTLNLRNLGSEPLELTLTLDDPGVFTLPNGENILPLGPGERYALEVDFTGLGLSGKGGVESALTIETQSQTIRYPLRGIYQPNPEGGRELYLAPLVNDGFGYPISFGENSQGGLTNSAADSPLAGSEVRSPYWQVANPGGTVTVTQIASFHSCCAVGDLFELYARDNPQAPFASMRQGRTDSNTIYPRKEGSETQAVLNTRPDTPFEIRVSGYSSNPVLGRGKGNLGPRFWPFIDAQGNAVAHTYLIAQDYVENGCGTTNTANCDYNDNIYIIENIEPAG